MPRKFFPVFSIWFALMPLRTANPCGYDPPAFLGYHLLAPEALGFPATPPFVLHLDQWYDYLYGDQTWRVGVDENIAEWRQYAGGAPTEADIAALVYSSTLDQLRDVERTLRQPAFELQDTLAGNTFASYLLRQRRADVLDYLLFAKQCEPFATRNTDWWDEEAGAWEEPDARQVDSLRAAGRAHWRTEADPSLRLRYAFQVVRLEHYYGGDPAAAYDELVGPLEGVGSVMRYWALGHKAGYLTLSKDARRRGEGNCLLAQVVAHTRGRLLSNYLSLNIASDREWQLALDHCRTGQERAALHFARALDRYSVALDDMREIYRQDPAFARLDLLLLREINKLEDALLNQKVPSDKTVGGKAMPAAAARAYLRQLKPFVREVDAGGGAANPVFWTIAAGYLDYLDGDYPAARPRFQAARSRLPAGAPLADQLELLEFALALSEQNAVDPRLEAWLGDLMTRNPFYTRPRPAGFDEYSYDQHDFISEKLAQLYFRAGQYGKAYLCRYSIFGLKLYPDVRIIREVLALYDQAEKNAFERYLLEKESVRTREELLELLGTALLGEYRLEEAREVFRLIPDAGPRIADPFTAHLKDRIPAPADENPKGYTKYQIVERLIELEEGLRSDPANAARRHLMLGAYHYNSSARGPAWRAIDYYISVMPPSRTLISPVDADPGSEFFLAAMGARGNKEYRDLTRARDHLRQAMAAADPELAARACFLLAAAERERHGFSGYFTGRPAEQPRTYFRRLATDFRHTGFYRQAIRECATFRLFARR